MTTAAKRAALLAEPTQRPPSKALEENRPTAEFEARDPDGFGYTIHTIPEHIPAEKDLPKRTHAGELPIHSQAHDMQACREIPGAEEEEPPEDSDTDFEPRPAPETEEEDFLQETDEPDEEPDPFDPGELIGDAMMQLAREDSCFCGTSGELAVRLIAALTLAEDASEARQVFVSFRCWASDVFPKKVRRKDGSWGPTKDVSQTTASPRTVDRLCAGHLCCRVEKSFSFPRGFPVSSACWVALDGSSCGVGFSRELWEELSVGFPRPAFQLIEADPNKLAAVVFLGSPGLLASNDLGSLQGGSRSGAAVSVSPAADLRLGSFVPGLDLRGSLGVASLACLADCLSRAKTPSSLVRQLLGRRSGAGSGACLRDDREGLAAFASPVFVSGVGFVGVGFGADLLPQLPVGGFCWVPLSWRSVWLLFGPPLHLLSPLPWGVLVAIDSCCRLFPDAPHEPEPAHLEETHSEALARELFATAAPTDWLGEEPDPPVRSVGPISAA